VRRAGLVVAVLMILATMLVGAYAMEAYVPASAARIVPTWGPGPDGSPSDGIELIGLRAAVLRGVRTRGPSDMEWASAMRVVVDDGSGGSRPPEVIGRYSVLRDRVRFQPRFPFAAGVTYRVEVEPRRLDALAGVASTGSEPAWLTQRFSLPAAQIDRTTRVLAVHPGIDHVPSNMLRFYIEFSSPMEPGSAHEHVHLLDETGRPVEGAFLRVDQELWDAQRRRLTLLFDPGRVKRGVRTNLEMGAPLIEGHRYRLVIDPAWPDARGATLASGYDKEFDVSPADRESPNPAQWRVSAPAAESREPLRLSFGEPLDHALVARMLSVEGEGRPVSGKATISSGDSAWTFTPASAWHAGTYSVRVDAALEDLAGNNVARLFDADRARGAPPAAGTERSGARRSVEFRVR
jgi:Bacterial Ig-like domain